MEAKISFALFLSSKKSSNDTGFGNSLYKDTEVAQWKLKELFDTMKTYSISHSDLYQCRQSKFNSKNEILMEYS